MLSPKNFHWKGLFVFLLSFAIASCSGMEEPNSPDLQSNLNSIPEILKTMENGDNTGSENFRKSAGNTYATFNAALAKSGLNSVFAQEELTVFAPNDAAFAELDLNPGNIGDLEGLSDILLYHVISGSVFEADLTNGMVPTLSGESVEISLVNGPMVNDANIVLTDKKARNGVIHGIDKVLLGPIGPPADPSILEIIEFDPRFSRLNFAINLLPALQADLAALSNATLFAPDDAAFDAVNLSEEIIRNSIEIFGRAAIVENRLRYHLFDGGTVLSTDLVDGQITMSQGGLVTVLASNPSLLDENNNPAEITDVDVVASNGVIHIINKVLTPL
ncbi:fasciclin domain-containing protein [Algoriphagus namhaensis]|uniref:Fasciclin domain-containing protein n=1 Tax=Algoriphagus namhaensis TaxID=915353 RepID=A0ABV8AST6_9BACT